MALITCPECGKQVSNQAPQCIHCGYPLQKAESAPSQQAETLFYQSDSANEASFLTDAPAPKAPAQADSKRKMLIIAACIVMVIVAALIAHFATANPIRLPYGITPDMTYSQMRDQMSEHGFAYDFENNYEYTQTTFYDPSYILGRKTSFTSLSRDRDGEYVSIGHCFYEDKTYGRNNPSSQFNTFKQHLLEEYGKPDAETSGCISWDSGNYHLDLDYSGSDGGVLWVQYHYRLSK